MRRKRKKKINDSGECENVDAGGLSSRGRGLGRNRELVGTVELGGTAELVEMGGLVETGGLVGAGGPTEASIPRGPTIPGGPTEASIPRGPTIGVKPVDRVIRWLKNELSRREMVIKSGSSRAMDGDGGMVTAEVTSGV